MGSIALCFRHQPQRRNAPASAKGALKLRPLGKFYSTYRINTLSSSMETSSWGFRINGLSIMLLKVISKHSPSVLEVRMKATSQVILTAEDFDQAITALKERGFIEDASQSAVRITDQGKQFLEAYNLYQHEEILEGNLVYVILKFLVELNDSITTKGFPKDIIDNSPQEYYGGTSENLTHFLVYDREMKQYVDMTQDERFSVNAAGKSKYRIELKKRTKLNSLEDYRIIVLAALEKQADFVSAILVEHDQTDPIMASRVEADLKDLGLIALTQQGAYITPSGQSYLARTTLGRLAPTAPTINVNHITTHGANSTITTGGEVSIGHLENKSIEPATDPNQKKSISIGRWTLILTLIGVVVALIIGILSLRHSG